MRHAAAAALTLMLGVSATDASTPPAKPPLVCLQASDIDHTQVISDEAILFYARGGQVWRNTLPRACPGLKFENGFSYEVRGGEVCSNLQIIRVLRRGASCSLGAFTREPPRKPAHPH